MTAVQVLAEMGIEVVLTQSYLLGKGERNPRSKLTAIQVVAIKNCLSNGETQKSIAEKVGVCDSTIWKIEHGINWKHVK